MNIQLIVENQLCDFDNKSYTTLQKEFISEDELIVKEVEFSYTISIPVSARNMQIFGFRNTFDVGNKFGKIYNAELYANEVLIIRGKLKLTEITKEYFKGNLYVPQKRTVEDVLGDRKLREIIPHMKRMNTLGDFTQNNNYVMGMNTVDIPLAQYRDRHVCYPYVLYQLPYNEVDNANLQGLNFYQQDLKYKNHTMFNNNIFPAFNVLSVIKDMFATEGYTVQGNVFTDDKFKDLYQTFQYTYADYQDQRESPYYLNFSAIYSNWAYSGDTVVISPTLSTETMWTEDSFVTNITDPGSDHFNGETSGSYLAGVDCPLMAGKGFTTLEIRQNDQHILKAGTNSPDSYVIVIPKDGWYRIHCDGRMNYTLKNSDVGRGGIHFPSGIYHQEDRESIGGWLDECDNTGLEEQPFEFQIKKGGPKDNPRLYSFNSGLPCMPVSYSQGDTVIRVNGAGAMAIKCPKDTPRQRYYGKNHFQTIIGDWSDEKPTQDLVGGARLGGAYFSDVYTPQYYGPIPRPNRWQFMGCLLALPRADMQMVFTDSSKKYFQIIDRNYNVDADVATGLRYEYANNTALVMLPKNNAHYNFAGYNIANYDTGWFDQTTNLGAKTIPYEDTSSVYTANTATTNGYDDAGSWVINDVVWFDKGDTINLECVMPQHAGGHYLEPGGGTSSNWVRQTFWINGTFVHFNFELGFVKGDKKWVPTADDKVPSFDNIKKPKETNVNKFLPDVKCNDYLNGFLKTFNLQLTHPSERMFSIDYATMNGVQGDVVSIDDMCHIDDAEFKSLDLPSTRQISWKLDKSETGYVHGNQSPYKTENEPWYESGYTGELLVTNETNTSGEIDKTESSWSYNWYKDMRFINGLGLSVTGCPVSVICDSSVYDTTSSYSNQSDEAPQTNKTSRLFFLGKNVNTSMYNYIEFKYDEIDGVDKTARLVLPSNSMVTKQTSGNREYLLDFNRAVNERRKSITDIFFNIFIQSGYQVNIPVKLDNITYGKIKSGTLIKLNDGYYKAKAIEGHDVSEQNFATMSLLTLT